MTSHASAAREGARTEHRCSGPARRRIPPTVDILSMHDASLDTAAVPSAPTSGTWSPHGPVRGARWTASEPTARAPGDGQCSGEDPTTGRSARDARAQQRRFLEILDDSMRDVTPDSDDLRQGLTPRPASFPRRDGEAS